MNRSFLHTSLGIAVVASLGMAIVSAQSAGSRPATPSPGTGGTARTPTLPTLNNPNSIPGQNTNQNRTPDFQRPVFLSGKVMLSDGTPPPDSVMIERVCGGRAIPEGTTDRKGQFSFQLGQSTAFLSDASTSGPISRTQGGLASTAPVGGMQERNLMNCELRAALPGFRSDTISLANHRSLDNPEVGTIILHRLGNVEGLTISATSLAAPKDAKKAFDKGHEALAKNKYEDAQKNLEKAVAEYPKYAIAWYDLGVAQEKLNNLDGARKSYAQALSADSKYINPYNTLANIAAHENKWQEVADITDRMIRLNPVDFPRAYFLNAVAKLNLKEIASAEKSANDLIAMDTQHQFPKAEHVMAIILAQKKDYNGAATHMRKFIELQQSGSDVDLARQQLQELEKSATPREQQQ